jgi:hypothetical protein
MAFELNDIPVSKQKTAPPELIPKALFSSFLVIPADSGI